MNALEQDLIAPLVAVACDYSIAPASLRERLVTSPEERQAVHRSLADLCSGAGFMALETCNRVVWFAAGNDPALLADRLKAEMRDCWTEAGYAPVDLPRLDVRIGTEAVRYALKIVVGWEALARGEAEIAGQFQKALTMAISEKTANRALSGLGRVAGDLARKAGRIGFRSARSRGVHILVGHFLAARFENSQAPVVAVAGMGRIGRKLADHLEHRHGWRVLRFNRTILEDRTDRWKPLSDLPNALADCNALVITTGARRAVLSSDLLCNGPDLVLDLGAPRQMNMAPLAGSDIHCFDIDDLLGVVQPSIAPEITRAVEEAVEAALRDYSDYCKMAAWTGLLGRLSDLKHSYTNGLLDAAIDDPVQRAAARALVGAYTHEIIDAIRAEILKDRS
ncbi:MAG: hypothetical protein U9N14_01295 [Pseudomonadota bacterium]|nr:hypothetical protein [Pseudomonadota bacterium]